MIFEPHQGRRIRAAVDETLQAEVAALVHEHDKVVLATFSVVTVFPPGDIRSARRSYSLEAIQRIDTQTELGVN